VIPSRYTPPGRRAVPIGDDAARDNDLAHLGARSASLADAEIPGILLANCERNPPLRPVNARRRRTRDTDPRHARGCHSRIGASYRELCEDRASRSIAGYVLHPSSKAFWTTLVPRLVRCHVYQLSCTYARRSEINNNVKPAALCPPADAIAAFAFGELNPERAAACRSTFPNARLPADSWYWRPRSPLRPDRAPRSPVCASPNPVCDPVLSQAGQIIGAYRCSGSWRGRHGEVWEADQLAPSAAPSP